MFDFDSTPPTARIFPSGLNASDVTLRPIVPADIEPIMFVIIPVIADISGICGMLPGLAVLIVLSCPGVKPPCPLIIWLRLAIGEEDRSRTLLPEPVSHNEVSPM